MKKGKAKGKSAGSRASLKKTSAGKVSRPKKPTVKKTKRSAGAKARSAAKGKPAKKKSAEAGPGPAARSKKPAKTGAAAAKARAPKSNTQVTSLARLQIWFGAAISRPLPGHYSGNPLAVSAPELAAAARGRLREKHGLDGFGRLGVYNEQYWFRLVSIMQADYTCAIHIMGLKSFNDWAVKYLQAHPPASPFLAELDARFPAFLAQHYRGGDREAALQAVMYERALSKAFDAPDGEPLANDPGAWSQARLRLAPHVTPLRVDYDFAAFRSLCIRDESLEGRFELPRAPECLVIYRDSDLQVMKHAVPATALIVLVAFSEPRSLGEAFESLEGALTDGQQGELEAHLSEWFQTWIREGWLCAQAAAEGRPAQA